MKYRIYTSPNQFGGIYIHLEIDGKHISEKYCGTEWGGHWYAYRLDQRVKAGKYKDADGTLYTGEINA